MAKLDDIARELGLSLTTVSRALTGNGRVSEATREKVKAYARSIDYTPNMTAKGLAEKRSFNLCALLPEDALTDQIPFFHRCLTGICEEAAKHKYDVLVTTVREDKLENLKRTLNANKADGYIILRSVTSSPEASLISSYKQAFVVLGVTEDAALPHIDTKDEKAAYDLTRKLLEKGSSSLLFLSGDSKHLVNRQRFSGIEKALEGTNAKVSKVEILTQRSLKETLDNLNPDIDTIICADDELCMKLLVQSRNLKGKKIATLYSNSLLDSIESIEKAKTSDAHKLGIEASRLLFQIIDK